MSHFYGRIEGSRGEATRCGTKSSGMHAIVRSWNGNLETTLHETDGHDVAYVSLRPEHGTAFTLGVFDHGAVLDAINVNDRRTLAAIDNLSAAFARLDRAASARKS